MICGGKITFAWPSDVYGRVTPLEEARSWREKRGRGSELEVGLSPADRARTDNALQGLASRPGSCTWTEIEQPKSLREPTRRSCAFCDGWGVRRAGASLVPCAGASLATQCGGTRERENERDAALGPP